MLTFCLNGELFCKVIVPLLCLLSRIRRFLYFLYLQFDLSPPKRSTMYTFERPLICFKTSRDEIAGCSEKAYDSLSISDARQMLLFSSDQELLEYIKEVSNSVTSKFCAFLISDMIFFNHIKQQKK